MDMLNDYGETALHLAAWNGNQVVVQLLLDSGADLQIRDKWGCTPLLIASDRKHAKVISLFKNKNKYDGRSKRWRAFTNLDDKVNILRWRRKGI